ncbi:hypothetical protein BpHYR1_009464 [Brachionus plicatilis]|uniref:Uncharacterized protein n=1 Tax=Brachionus plicatilis TaxID=10195 RepID=A0A3M7PQL3_BRAPC|nr:hypothetical protein BpHYR1_009464 [Brachionus plicatilis]
MHIRTDIRIMCQIFTSQHNSSNIFWITLVPSILPCISICVQKANSISSLCSILRNAFKNFQEPKLAVLIKFVDCILNYK